MTSLAGRFATYLDHDWYRSIQAQEILHAVIDKNTQKRKQFGLLEKPSLPPQLNIEEYEYKIFLCGRTGVGKSCTVAKLAGAEIPKLHYDTPGIGVTSVYWPVLLTKEDRVVVFRLEFWDAGDMAIREFDHILPACKEKSDAVIFVFSFVDKPSFDELSQQMARIITPTESLATLVIGTKFDQHAKSEVTLRDIREFESVYRLPILRIKNIPVYHPSGSRSDLTDTAPILNTICEHLWRRDQDDNTRNGDAVATYV